MSKGVLKILFTNTDILNETINYTDLNLGDLIDSKRIRSKYLEALGVGGEKWKKLQSTAKLILLLQY